MAEFDIEPLLRQDVANDQDISEEGRSSRSSPPGGLQGWARQPGADRSRNGAPGTLREGCDPHCRHAPCHSTPPILCPGPKSRIAGVGETTKPYRLPGRAVLLIRAGTATSTRQAWRGECLQCHTDRSARCGNRLHGLAAWGGTVRGREHGAVQADRGGMVASGACTGIVNSQAVAEAASKRSRVLMREATIELRTCAGRGIVSTV